MDSDKQDIKRKKFTIYPQGYRIQKNVKCCSTCVFGIYTDVGMGHSYQCQHIPACPEYEYVNEFGVCSYYKKG